MKYILFLILLCTTTLYGAEVKISQLPLGNGSTVGSADSFPYVSAANNTTRRLAIWDLINVPAFTSTYAPLANPTFTGTATFNNATVTGGFNFSAASLTGTIPVANGGTNSSTSLNNDRVMISSGGAIVESAVTSTELGYLDGIANTAGGLVYGNGTTLVTGSAGTAQNWMLSNGTSGYTFSNTTTTGKMIDGSADEIQLLVQAHSTQTSNVFVVENSGGTDRLVVTGNGNVVIPTTASAGYPLLTLGTATPISNAWTNAGIQFNPFSLLYTHGSFGAAIHSNYYRSTDANTFQSMSSVSGQNFAAAYEQDNAGIRWRFQNSFSSSATAPTAVGGISTAGAWSIGASGDTQSHSINGNIAFPNAAAATGTGTLDVTGRSLILCNTSGGNVVINNLSGGVAGQVIHLWKSSSSNTCTITAGNSTGGDPILTGTAADIVISSGGYGGATLVRATNTATWFVIASDI